MTANIFKLRSPFILASGSPRRREMLSWLGFDFTVMTAKSESGPRLGEAPLDYALRAAAEKAVEVLNAATVQTTNRVTLANGEDVADKTGPGPAAPVVLGADTIVVLDGKIYGKPGSHAEAHATLKRLAGQTHEVITACCLLLPPAPSKRGAAKELNTSLAENADTGEETLTSGARQAATKAQSGLAMPFMDESAHNGGYTMLRFAQSSRVSMWNCPDNVLRAYAGSEEPMDKAGAYAVQGHGGFLIRAIEGSWSSVVGLPVAELAQILLTREVIYA